MSPPLVAALAWAVLLLALYLLAARRPARLVRSPGKAALIVALCTLVARLVPNLILPVGATYDIDSYGIVSDLVRQGADVYSDPATRNRHPYLPLQMYWMAAARSMAISNNLSFVKIVRMAPILADVAIALLVFRMLLGRRQVVAEGLMGGLLYALNPVPVFVSAYHGQFDALPLLGILLAIQATTQRPGRAGGWLGLAILNKSWPVLVLPVLLQSVRSWSGRVRLLIGVIAVPLLAVTLYAGIFDSTVAVVLRKALGYNWGIGVWGYTYSFRLLSVLDPRWEGVFQFVVHNARYLTLVLLGWIWLRYTRSKQPVQGVLTMLVAFMAVTHAFSIQYLVWVVPFAILGGDTRWLTRYTVAAFFYMALVYFTFVLEMHITRLMPMKQADPFLIIPASLPAWLVTVAWLWQRLRQHTTYSAIKVPYVYGS